MEIVILSITLIESFLSGFLGEIKQISSSANGGQESC
jgi:hypothetical protein